MVFCVYNCGSFQPDYSDARQPVEMQGCSVIWSYMELFGSEHLAKAVFVDQAPLQNTTADWTTGSKGCFDGPSLAGLQATLHADMRGFAQGAPLAVPCCSSLHVSGGGGCPVSCQTQSPWRKNGLTARPHVQSSHMMLGSDVRLAMQGTWSAVLHCLSASLL